MLHVTRVGLTVRGQLPRHALEQHLPASLDSLGQQLAKQIDDYVKQNDLGYYPALDFFRQTDGVDSYLLDAVDQVVQIAVTMTKDEVMRILTPVFSSVRVESILSMVYAIPTIRPGQKNAQQQLALHYIPDIVKFELFVTMLQRREAEPGSETGAKKIAWRWLKDAFEDMEVTSARLITVKS